MEFAILVARVLAVIYLSVAVLAMRGKADYKKIIKSFENSPALTIMTGMAAILIGMIIIMKHNVWMMEWQVLITIVGWASLIKGILLIAYPEMMYGFKHTFKDTKKWSIVLVAIGLVFGYFGFVI